MFRVSRENKKNEKAYAHLHIKVPPHSVDSYPVESSVRQVVEGGAEYVRTPVCLQVIPDLQTP